MTRRVLGDMLYGRPHIAEQYESSRRLSRAMLTTWLRALSTCVPIEEVTIIADVGCGAGRFFSPLARHFRARVVGIDPSKQMCERARAGGSRDVTVLPGRAESIPLPAASVDLAFLSMVYHHMTDHDQAILEFRRILRPIGYLCIRTSTTDCLHTVPYLPYFPEAKLVNQARLPSRHALWTRVTSHGFQCVLHDVICQKHADSLAAYLPSVRARTLSDLAAIPDNSFEVGLARMATAAQQTPVSPVFEAIDLFVFRAPP